MRRYLTTTIHATMHGRTWEGFTAQMPLTLSLARIDRARRPLPLLLADALRNKGGDFHPRPRLTADSFARVECTRIGNGRVRKTHRDILLVDLPSAADFVDPSAISAEGCE